MAAISGGLAFVAVVKIWCETEFVVVLKTPMVLAVGSVNQISPFEMTSCVGPPLVLLLSSAEYSWMLERSRRSSNGSKTSGRRCIALRQARSLPVSVVFALSRCRGLILSILAMQIPWILGLKRNVSGPGLARITFVLFRTESKRYSMPPSSASFNVFRSGKGEVGRTASALVHCVSSSHGSIERSRCCLLNRRFRWLRAGGQEHR